MMFGPRIEFANTQSPFYQFCHDLYQPPVSPRTKERQKDVHPRVDEKKCSLPLCLDSVAASVARHLGWGSSPRIPLRFSHPTRIEL
jgi:hypothetical protein